MKVDIMNNHFQCSILFFLIIIYSTILVVKGNDSLNDILFFQEENEDYFNLTDSSYYLIEINYDKEKNFTLKNENRINLIYQIQSINCKYNLKINNIDIVLKEEKDKSFFQSEKKSGYFYDNITIVGKNDYESDYDNECFISINSFIENSPIYVSENDKRRYYMHQDLNELSFKYELTNLTIESFFAFSLRLEDLIDFEINVFKNDTLLVKRKISTSTTIFLTKEEIYNSSSLYIDNEEDNILIININRNNPTDDITIVDINFYSREPKPELLIKNFLYRDFSTNKIEYKYYYFKLSNNEEGEIMLNNKRRYGELYAKFVDGEKTYINDTDNYPNRTSNQMRINKHTKRLEIKVPDDYSKNNQNIYVLVSYYHQNNDSSNIFIGFEFSLLVRIWDKVKSTAQIIDIPSGEYIYGVFEKNTIVHHYYSFYIPKEIKKIILQIKGNYIDAFKGKRKQKLYTFRPVENIDNLNLGNDVYYKEINTTEINDEYISFAFRSKNFFSDNYAYYYFRLLQFRADDIIVYPLDTNQGNICEPSWDDTIQKYKCYFLLKNFYHEFDLNHAITSTDYNRKYYIIQSINELEEMKITDITHTALNNKINNFHFDIHNHTLLKNVTKYNNNTDYIIYIFLLDKGELLNVISKYYEDRETYYHSIYSTELYYFYDINEKTFEFDVNNKYFMYINWINGEGNILLSWDNSIREFNKNMRGKSPSFIINGKTNITVENAIDFVFSIRLDYQTRLEFREIIFGQPFNEEYKDKLYPICLYILCNQTNEIDITIKYNKEDKNKPLIFLAYLLDEEKMGTLLNNINPNVGEIINSKNNDLFNFVTYHISPDNITTTPYLFLYVYEDEVTRQFSGSFDIIAFPENNDSYTVPINTYITGSFNRKVENSETNIIKYSIITDNVNDILIFEFDSNCLGIFINFRISDGREVNYTFEENTKNFQINITLYDIEVQINAKPDTITTNTDVCNYMFRYYYDTKTIKPKIFFKKEVQISEVNNFIDSKNISFLYSDFEIFYDGKKIEYINNDIEIIFLLQIFDGKIDEYNKKESLNTFSITSSTPKYKDMKKLNNIKECVFYFNIHNTTTNCVIQLKILGKKKDDSINILLDSVATEKDLSYLFEEEPENKSLMIAIIISCVIITILIIIVIIVVIYFKKYKKKSSTLSQKISSLEFSTEKNILNEETNPVSKKDNDYELTYI